jgi:predicted lipase
MVKYTGTVALVLMLLTVLSSGKKEETLEQLIARADASRPEQQPDLYVEIAERQMKALTESSKSERWEEFRPELQQVVKYCERAQASAIESKKKIKHTEIKIRQISQRLRDLKLDVDVDDQASVQSAVDKLEHFRAELFKSMFGLGDKNND